MNEEAISVPCEIYFIFFDVIDFFKDILYTTRFPHYSRLIVLSLWFSIIAPFSISWSFTNDFFYAIKIFFGMDIL